MFTKKVTDDDNFMALSSSAQALYLHLTMSADDDGFCNQVSLSMFKAHASVQDLQALLEKRYILQFEDGVIVIKHWRMANSLRRDRYTPTAFQEDLARLELKDNGAYSWLPNGCQVVAERLPQNRKDKDRVDKGRLEENNIPPNTLTSVIPPSGEPAPIRKQIPPTVEMVKEYMIERGKLANPEAEAEAFWDHYNSNGWKVGRNPMKDWQSSVRNWERTEYGGKKIKQKEEGFSVTEHLKKMQEEGLL